MNAASSINGSVAATRLRPGFYDPLADEPETVAMNTSVSTQSAFAETQTSLSDPKPGGMKSRFSSPGFAEKIHWARDAGD